MRSCQNLFFLIAITASIFAQNVKPVADRVAAQNTLFDEQYESDLRNFPERATAFGDYRYNDKLADRSLAAIAQFHKTDQGFLARLEAIPTTGFNDQDQLSHERQIGEAGVDAILLVDGHLVLFEIEVRQRSILRASLPKTRSA